MDELTLPLSDSYRTNKHIASKISNFCANYMNPIRFNGKGTDEALDGSIGYISRTNSSLISAMSILSENNLQFRTVRPANEIFRIILAIIELEYGSYFRVPELLVLNPHLIQFYYNRDVREAYDNDIYGFLKDSAKAEKMHNAYQACKIILSIGEDKVVKTYNVARENENNRETKILLGTAFGFKGLTVDKAVLLNDVDETFTSVLEDNMGIKYDDLDPLTAAEYNLVYVAGSRARKEISGSILFE